MSGPLIQLQRRNDLAANWTSSNPVLAEGEIGIEWDTNWHKIGDGTTAWNDLTYYHGPPWWAGLDGGSPTSTYGGAPSVSYEGVMCSKDPGFTQIGSTTVIPSGDFDNSPGDIATDGNGNWVLLCAGNNIYYSSDLTTWTKTASTISTVTALSSIATNKTGVWVAFATGQNSIYRSVDNGVTWTEIYDQTTNFNGVNHIFWSESTGNFITNGQSQLRYSPDGLLPWSGTVNGGTSAPIGFIMTPSFTFIYGSNGLYQPRNGYAQGNITNWTMNNDMPNTGNYSGTPSGGGGYDGTNYALAANAFGGFDHEYWYSGTFASPWASGSTLRYDNAKTDAIIILRHLDAIGKWVIVTDQGDPYFSDDITAGESGWTEQTTGNLPGNAPRSTGHLFDAEGSEAWVYISSLSKVIVNRYS